VLGHDNIEHAELYSREAEQEFHGRRGDGTADELAASEGRLTDLANGPGKTPGPFVLVAAPRRRPQDCKVAVSLGA